jgi:predicted  nucleic acid-binding Zn-ribbon protein
MTARRSQKKIDTIEKLAELVVDSMDDLRSDMSGRFDSIGDQISALQERVAAVESKIAGLHRRIDQELDVRKQHDVRLSRIERHLQLPETA